LARFFNLFFSRSFFFLPSTCGESAPRHNASILARFALLVAPVGRSEQVAAMKLPRPQTPALANPGALLGRLASRAGAIARGVKYV
jgi:hypothetical protein